MAKADDKCPYCGFDGDDVCAAEHGRFYCTRAPGHEGKHVACGRRDHHIAWWPQGTGSEAVEGE